MASSSVSQDDIDTDFEKNSRRSRIRTARARQINPCRANEANDPEEEDHNHHNYHHHHHHSHHHHHLNADVGGALLQGANGGAVNADHETSPKSAIRSAKDAVINSKRPTKLMMNHHLNKGKQQQRERRKLREKRRSTGVVHLASTESTGGSTTGDDEESSGDALAGETKRNTQQNETVEAASSAANAAAPLPSCSALSGAVVRSFCRDKSTSDLEADDENDTHDARRNIPASNALLASCDSNLSTASTTPVIRPGTPTNEEIAVDKVVEENKRLLSMMGEKDKRIHNLEFKIQQLMKELASHKRKPVASSERK